MSVFEGIPDAALADARWLVGLWHADWSPVTTQDEADAACAALGLTDPQPEDAEVGCWTVVLSRDDVRTLVGSGLLLRHVGEWRVDAESGE